MADEPRKGSWWAVVLAVLFLPVLYVASVGPAARLLERTSDPPEVVRVFYSPLD
jgi:hypothetical protein